MGQETGLNVGDGLDSRGTLTFDHPMFQSSTKFVGIEQKPVFCARLLTICAF